MPWASGAQRGWGHTPAGEKALGGPAKVAEWDAASKGQHVPYKVGSHASGGPVVNKGYLSKTEAFAAGGPVLARSGRSWAKPDINNSRAADEKPTYGDILDGTDRFTSSNPSDQGLPANVQRTKPDEDWTKAHVGSKAIRSGDTKSEKPVKPRG
jgi:hypothetical protein